MLFDALIAELIHLRDQAVEEIAVVTDHNHRSVELCNRLLQDILRAHIQMVRRLIEDQQIDRFEKQTDHGKTALFSSTEHTHLLVRSFPTKHEGTENIANLGADITGRHVVDRLEDRLILVEQLCLVLCKIADDDIVTDLEIAGKVINLTHDTLDECGLSFAVLSDECHFLTATDHECGMIEHLMITVTLAYIFENERIGTGTRCGRELQADSRIVDVVHLDTLHLLQLFDAALHLCGFGRLVAETFDESFRVGQHLLLVLVSTELLFATFLAKLYIIGIFDFIIVYLTQLDLDGPRRRIVDEGAVVRNEHHGIGTRGDEGLKPLDGFDIEMIRGLIEQQHLRTTEQQLRQFDSHTPTSTELRCIAVEIFPVETETDQRTLQFRLIIGSTQKLELFGEMGKAFDDLLIGIGFVVGALSQLIVQVGNLLLHLMDMGESCLGLFTHGARVGQLHLLRKIADGDIFLDGDRAGGRNLMTGKDLEQSGFTCAVLTHKGNSVFGIDDKRHTIEQRETSELNS